MSLLHQAPSLTAEEITRVARDLYNLVARAEELPSERDQNFLLTTQASERFVIKIANAAEQRLLLEAQNEALSHLASRVSFCPRVIFQENKAIFHIRTATAKHYVRLVTYLSGETLANANHSAPLLFELGRRLGELDRALSDFDHHAFHREFHWDLAHGRRVINEYVELVTESVLRGQVKDCCAIFDRTLATEQLAKLPCQVIHGDANDHNVLVEGECVVGIIDFGDMIYSYRVAELAVALAYAVLEKSDPLKTAKVVTSGYLSACYLNDNEIAAIWPLMLMRLCMSVSLAAHQRKQKPENEYLDISQRAIRNTLPRLLAIDPAAAAHEFRVAEI